MKKIIRACNIAILTITLLISCKKNIKDVLITKEQPVVVANQNLKNWLLQNGGFFKRGNIKTLQSNASLKDGNSNDIGLLDWNRPINYSYKGFAYTEICYVFSAAGKNETKNNSKFSLVFRKNNNKLEAKFKTFTRVLNITDSSKIYVQESFYNLNGELSEVWLHINNKTYKIDKKLLSTSYIPTGIANRTCTTVTLDSYSPVLQNNDGSCYVIHFVNFYQFCVEDEEEVESTIDNNDFGGYSVNETIFETPELLQFEFDYKSRMSAEELVIYNNLSRAQQLNYLLNAQAASDAAENAYPLSLHNGKGDAFRHALFNALNAKDLGLTLAESLSTAHENVPSPITLEKQMDLLNNQVGRNTYSYLNQLGLGGILYTRNAINALNELMANGGLYYLDPLNADGSINQGVTILKPSNQ